MTYPPTDEPESVGTWPAKSWSGGGFFYDHVLEYRVWLHPERGAPDEFDGEDYFYAFATYEKAVAFFTAEPGAEPPLVLIRQLEWIDEPQPGVLIHKRDERIAEWLPEWLVNSKREHETIARFLQEHHAN